MHKVEFSGTQYLTYCDHWSSEESPRKKLQEDDNKGMIETGLPYAGTLQRNKTVVHQIMHLSTFVIKYYY